MHSGTLPPQLLLETLLSLYHVLFPVSVDNKSARLVRSLERKSKFDPDMKIDNGTIRALPDDFEYIYWGQRLEILRDITANPPPTNRFVSWVERHKSERNALAVAIIGLTLTALFGFLSFVVSILAWRYPVKT